MKTTVKENLTLFSTIYGMSDKEIKMKSDEVFHALEMEDMATLVKDIPTGWKQKLAFSAATMHTPDGSFSMSRQEVSIRLRRRFWELIYKASSQGMTIFVTTHYLDEAEYCNRISIMVDGRIKALDSPENLKKRI